MQIMHESYVLTYRTFDTSRSVHRSEVAENKRLQDMLSIVAEMRAGREQRRSKSGPRNEPLAVIVKKQLPHWTAAPSSRLRCVKGSVDETLLKHGL
ncbi:hypothetical protein ACVJBD_007644 [Rhizobium mongolense]